MELNLASFARLAKKYRDGHMIFSEFEMGDTFYFIQSGQVESLKLDGNTQKTLAVLKPMEMFGKMAILESSPRSATAIAHRDCVLLEFNSKNFQSLMMGLPELAMKLLKLFITRMYDSKSRYLLLKKQSPHGRLAETFVRLVSEIPIENRTGEEQIINANVELLVRLSGLTEEQTWSTMDDFSKEKRIEIRAGRILIKKVGYFKNYLQTLSKG
jgi:CRP-like cAMP-binding protein